MTVYNSTMSQQSVASRMEVPIHHKSSYRIPKKDSRRSADNRVRQAVKELKRLKEEITLQYDINRRKIDKVIDKLYSN